MLESWIREITFTTSLVVEGVSALIVAYAVLEAIARLIVTIPRHSGTSGPQVAHNVKEEIRLRLAAGWRSHSNCCWARISCVPRSPRHGPRSGNSRRSPRSGRR